MVDVVTCLETLLDQALQQMVHHRRRELRIRIEKLHIDQPRSGQRFHGQLAMKYLQHSRPPVRRVLERCAFRIRPGSGIEKPKNPTNRRPLLLIILRLLEVKIFDDSQCKRVRLQDLRLGLDNHVDFERIGGSVCTIRLDAQGIVGLFLDFDLTHRLIAPRGKKESQNREQKERGKTGVDDRTAAHQHRSNFP